MSVLLLTTGDPDNLLLVDGTSDLLLEQVDAVTGTAAVTLPALTADADGEIPTVGTVTASLPVPTAEAAGGVPVTGTVAASLPLIEATASGTAVTVTGTATVSLPVLRAAAIATSETIDPDTGTVVARVGASVRSVAEDGTMISLHGVNVVSIRTEKKARQQAVLEIGTLEPDAAFFDLFANEVQIWLDDDTTPYYWGRPVEIHADIAPGTDKVTVTSNGIYDYLYDEVVGQIPKTNHILSPHEDTAAVGDSPADWDVVGDIEDAAIVDNNAEFYDSPKAIQVNNSEAGQDAYIRRRVTWPAELDRVPVQAMMKFHIADDVGGAPEWSGPAVNNRGLMIFRRDASTGRWLSAPQIARITNETPRNQPQRIQTGSLLPLAGQQIEVRAYSPGAWMAIRFIGVYDGRWIEVAQEDKSVGITRLVAHAQDVSIGKQNHRILTELENLGETISRRWPWWRRDNIGEEVDKLADTFDYEMVYTSTTRTLRVGSDLGVTRATTLTKAQLADWTAALSLAQSYSRVIRLGDGDGIARDEQSAVDTEALRGHVRELVTFGSQGESLAQLRDRATEDLNEAKNIRTPLRFKVTGDVAKEARPYDTYPVNLDHGWAQQNWNGEVQAVDYFPARRVADLHLEPV